MSIYYAPVSPVEDNLLSIYKKKHSSFLLVRLSFRLLNPCQSKLSVLRERTWFQGRCKIWHLTDIGSNALHFIKLGKNVSSHLQCDRRLNWLRLEIFITIYNGLIVSSLNEESYERMWRTWDLQHKAMRNNYITL